MNNQKPANVVVAKRDFDVFAKSKKPQRRHGLWARM
jgi:hypothetical protein